MFRWYGDAEICYAYLSDVENGEDPTTESSSFASSRWFTRGWTLQELLAPVEVIFLASDWVEIGTKKSLHSTVSRVTGISESVLDEVSCARYSVAQMMSWAAGRRTTRSEDRAYCLMGLFDINMPLLYGEGRKAFTRLQHEIKQSGDRSIFAWSYPAEENSYTQMSVLLAPSLKCFKESSRIQLLDHKEGQEHDQFEVVNQLVRISLQLLDEVRELKLRLVRNKPLLYNIVEIQQTGKGAEQVEHTLPRPLESRRDDERTDRTSTIPTPRYLSTPRIIVEDFSPTPVQGLRIVSAFRNEAIAVEMMDSGVRRGTTGKDLLLDSHSCDPEHVVLAGPESRRAFIYEPVTIVPLRCHIEKHQLGILLTQNSAAPHGGYVAAALPLTRGGRSSAPPPPHETDDDVC